MRSNPLFHTQQDADTSCTLNTAAPSLTFGTALLTQPPDVLRAAYAGRGVWSLTLAMRAAGYQTSISERYVQAVAADNASMPLQWPDTGTCCPKEAHL